MSFQPLYFFPSALTLLSGLEANPCGNLTRDRTSQNSFLFTLSKTYTAGAISRGLPSFCTCKSFLIPRCVKSILDFKVSFVMPSILRSVPIMLSHIFFSMCITSRFCRRSKSFQYPKSHKVDLRVNNNLSSALPRFLFLLPLSGWFPGVICLTFSNSTCNSSAVSLFGASECPCFALNTCLWYFLGHVL